MTAIINTSFKMRISLEYKHTALICLLNYLKVNLRYEYQQPY
jgi:hypothetical protein